MKKKIILIFVLFTIVSACGFKVVNQDQLRNFNIEKIVASGDKRINYFIKNKLKINRNIENKKLITLNLNTKKTKSVKEKNIKNEITKYEIRILVDIKFTILGENKVGSFALVDTGDYDVSKIHSQTFNNEKNLIKILTENISDELNENLVTKVNEL
jgi:outer membrane lipopolysaccharide assembly protein LptE/RlpB